MSTVLKPICFDNDGHLKPSALHVEHARISLQEAVPKNASEYISEDLVHNVERQLVDWSLNFMRSLLFYSEPRKEWGGEIPRVMEPGCEIYVMPLDCSNKRMIRTLVGSNLYREHHIDKKIRTQMAEGTVAAIRDQTGGRPLTLIEWRQIIEGYLLNLACEAQTRVDYKREVVSLKKTKLMGQTATARMSAEFRYNMMAKRGRSFDDLINQVEVTEEEMQETFQRVQLAIYKRLGLDWEADTVEF